MSDGWNGSDPPPHPVLAQGVVVSRITSADAEFKWGSGMASFIRKNEIVCSGTFTASDGSGAVPQNAEAVLVYTGVSGSKQTDQVPLAEVNGVWTGVWDSSNALEGPVDWMIHCWDGLIAATEGTFFIRANKANTI